MRIGNLLPHSLNLQCKLNHYGIRSLRKKKVLIVCFLRHGFDYL